MNIKNLFASVFTTLALLATPALADGWVKGGITEMNKEIEQTNFIVNNNCSGTLISTDLRLILTNHHCLDRSISTETRNVTTENGEVVQKKFEKLQPVMVSQKVYDGFDVVSLSSLVGEIVGYDKTKDLGLIQLKVNSIPQTKQAIFYEGDVVRGMEVYTVGNPLMLDATVGKGIISSTTRKLTFDGIDVSYYQMDAVVEGGSSGGSMYTLDGQMIGVPGAKYTGTDINMAVPLPAIKKFLADKGYDIVAGVVVKQAEEKEDE